MYNTFAMLLKQVGRMTSLTIAMSCTYFQRRLCWMLSSLVSQKTNGFRPKMVIDVAYPKDNGSPTTEKVCSFFRDLGLNILETQYADMSEIQYRGLVRNRQLAQCDTEWILFADCDMVYDRFFFDDLGKRLEGELKDERKLMSARRVSLDKPFCKDFFNTKDDHKYPSFIANADEICSTWPIYQISRNIGAGYFQLINVNHVKDNHGGIYVDPSKNKDWSWDKMQKANSDKQFRKMVGGIRRILTKPQYHLNHERDNEEGRHLTIQR
jgi:hypothetical protein